MQEQVIDALSLCLLPVAASLVLLGLLSREMRCCYTAAVVRRWQFVKKGQSVMRSILEQEFQNVFVVKVVVDHWHKSLYNKNLFTV